VYAPATGPASPEYIDAATSLPIQQQESQCCTGSCYHLIESLSGAMKLLLLISNAFINTMGITQPSPKAANRAAWFIVIMLGGVIALVATIATLAIHWASHH
jgi:archaellum biogenesis protein FlaJ (TadC family)